MRAFLRHAFVGALTFVPAYVAAGWVPLLLELPPARPGRLPVPWRAWLVPDVATGLLFAGLGALVVLALARRRLARWRAVTLGRSALVGALAGALAAGSAHWVLGPLLDALFDRSTPLAWLPLLAAAGHAATLGSGALAVGLLYFPWLTAAPTPQPLRADV